MPKHFHIKHTFFIHKLYFIYFSPCVAIIAFCEVMYGGIDYIKSEFYFRIVNVYITKKGALAPIAWRISIPQCMR